MKVSEITKGDILAKSKLEEYRELGKLLRQQGNPTQYIFNMEFDVLKPEQKQRDSIIAKYEKHYVSGLMNTVIAWLQPTGFKSIDELDSNGRKARSKAVRDADEKELFERLAKCFHKKLRAHYVDDELLATAIESRGWNCYAVTVLLSDVLERLGKHVTIIHTTNHMLLRCTEQAFGITEDAGLVTYSIKELEQHHPVRQEGGIDLLLSTAYDWCGIVLARMGKYTEALAAHNTAIDINPDNGGMWSNRGVVLDALGILKEAYASVNRATDKEPNNPDLWYNKGMALLKLGESDKAQECLAKATLLREIEVSTETE